jgi:hypothetical protein
MIGTLPVKAKLTRLESFPGKKGEMVRATFSMFGASFTMLIPERLVPDCLEGQEYVVDLRVAPGKWLQPEIRLGGLTPA